jgi:hypothetical protein
MGLVGETHVICNVANPAVGVARVTKNEQTASETAAAYIGLDANPGPQLPVELAARDTEVAGQRRRAQVFAMEVFLNVSAQPTPEVAPSLRWFDGNNGTEA